MRSASRGTAVVVRLARGLQSLWINLGIALLIVAMIEGIGRLPALVPSAGRSFGDTGGGDIHANPEFLREFHASDHVAWRSYVYWRRTPFHGKYINVDEQGLRHTWNSPAAGSAQPVKVFMFGGSTMWGTNARDDFTIPSLTSKALAPSSREGVRITNFGETGYVSTQELIALMLELQRGNVPNIVVFYDGFNDTFAAYQNGVAGIPQNEANRATEFNSRDKLNWREGFVKKLMLYRWGSGLSAALRAEIRKQPFYARMAQRLHKRLPSGASQAHAGEALANSVVDRYLHNVAAVEALSKQYGFRAVFFWQPTVFTKQHRSAQEQDVSTIWSTAAPFYAQVNGVYHRVLENRHPLELVDLSGVFRDTVETMFVDEVHVNETGNARIAEAMGRVLRGMISK